MTAKVQIRGQAELIRNIDRLTKGLSTAKAKKAMRPAASLLARESKKVARQSIRHNRRKYPAAHPQAKGGTGNLLRGIKVKTRRYTVQVLSHAPHSWLVEHGHKDRGGGRVRGYPFLLGILPRLERQQLTIITREVQKILARAVK